MDMIEVLPGFHERASIHDNSLFGRRIYTEREALHARAARCLTSGAERGQSSAELPAALAGLKRNLAAEMRAVSEQHFLVFRMLLSCTQVTCLPLHVTATPGLQYISVH